MNMKNMVSQVDAAAGSSEPAVVIRRPMGGTERMMYIAEQSFNGTFRIAAVLTLASEVPVTAAALTAAVHAVAARHDALRTVVVGGNTFAAAPPGTRPTVDVTAVPSGAGGVTAAAFADCQAVLTSGTGGARWASPTPPLADGLPDRLPWQAGVYLPAPGVAHDPTDAAALVWFLPHYLSDGTSVDVLAAATVDALAATAMAEDEAARADAVAAAGTIVPLAPHLGKVYPPPLGGVLGTAVGVVRFLTAEAAAPLTRRHRRALVRPPGPPATAATRTASAVDAVVVASAVRKFARAAKAAGTTVGCGLVAALALALDDVGVVGSAGSAIPIDLPVNGRVEAPKESGLTPTTVGCYLGAGIIEVPVAGGGDGKDRPDLWALASTVHALIHSPGYRAAEVSAFGVLGEILSSPPGRVMMCSSAASASDQGRIIAPAVSNVGRCKLTDAANVRAVTAGDGPASPTVSAIRLMDWEAQIGAPLVLYSCSVGGEMCLVLTSVQPLVPKDKVAAVLAAVVQTIESA